MSAGVNMQYLRDEARRARACAEQAEKCGNGGNDEKGYRKALSRAVLHNGNVVDGILYNLDSLGEKVDKLSDKLDKALATPFYKRFTPKEWAVVIGMLSVLSPHPLQALQQLIKLLGVL